MVPSRDVKMDSIARKIAFFRPQGYLLTLPQGGPSPMLSSVAARRRLPRGHLRAMPAPTLANSRYLTVQHTKTSSIVLNGSPAFARVVTGRGPTANRQNRQL